MLLGWDPSWAAGAAIAAVALGTAAFGGLGMLMAGRLRGEVTLAAANGLYLVLLLLGGMVFPLSELPDALEPIAEALPAAALADLLQAAAVGASGDALGDWAGAGGRGRWRRRWPPPSPSAGGRDQLVLHVVPREDLALGQRATGLVGRLVAGRPPEEQHDDEGHR